MWLMALLCAGISSAWAGIDADLAALITTSDDVEITEVTNDEAYPWEVTDGVAVSTNGKASGYVESAITIRFRCKGNVELRHQYMLNTTSNYNYRRIYIDGVREVNDYPNNTAFTSSVLYRNLAEGEHELKIANYHNYYTSNSYTQQLSVRDIRIITAESQYKTINLSEAGTLGVEALGLVNSLPEMRYLRLTGTMNATDWTTISRMTGLVGIDMKNTTVTDIPASAFSNTILRFVTLPRGLKTIGEKAFYDRYLTGELVLPDGLQSIGNNAFYRNLITEVTIPNGVTSMGTYAFQDNDQLKTVTLGDGLTSISDRCFDGCDSLHVVRNCGNIITVGSSAFNNCLTLRSTENMAPKTIYSDAFRYCRQLKDLDLTKAVTIGSNACYDCDSLKTLDLQSCTSLGDNAFCSCSYLESVRLNDQIQTIPNYCFQDCSRLQEAILGASVRSVNYYSFYTSSGNFKRLYINSPAPPSVSTPLYTRTGVTLYVPEYAMTSYKLHSYWSQFTSVEKNPYPVKDIVLYSNLELTSNVRIPDAPSMNIGWSNSVGGSFVINGNNAQELGDYIQYINHDTYSATMISRCNAVNCTSATMRVYCPNANTYWYYVCMPYDVKRSDITTTAGAGLAVRYYDSESRANSGSGSNWKNVPMDATLKEGQGYIFCVSTSCYVYLPGTDDTRNNVFKSNAVEQPLNEYPTEVSNDANWNLVGNPYPAYYDIYYMDYTAPLTVWNTKNKTFTAYSVADDDLVLYPLQAFFVQKPTLVDAITFHTAGRQLTNVIDHSAGVKAQQMQARKRQLVNLVLTDGQNEDVTRVVVNPEASDDFCADNDASKMLAYEGTPQFYTLRGQDIYAINEGAQAEGSVQLGMLIPADGTYTIDVKRADVSVQLMDRGEAVQMPYTFDASEGTDESRFVLAITGNATGVAGVQDNNAQPQTIYNLNGVRVNSTAQKGVYIQNNKKIVK